MHTRVGGRRSKVLEKVHMGRHFNLAPGQCSWVWREMSGQGSVKSFTSLCLVPIAPGSFCGPQYCNTKRPNQMVGQQKTGGSAKK